MSLGMIYDAIFSDKIVYMGVCVCGGVWAGVYVWPSYFMCR